MDILNLINFSPKLEVLVDKEILSCLSTSLQICNVTIFYGHHIPLYLHFSSSANYFHQKGTTIAFSQNVHTNLFLFCKLTY